jgi:ActR/RegA family two-component response regulator
MELLETVRRKHPETRVIIVTGFATVPSAIEAIKKGAFNYITKPYKRYSALPAPPARARPPSAGPLPSRSAESSRASRSAG